MNPSTNQQSQQPIPQQEVPKLYDPVGLGSAKERIPLRFRIMGYKPSTSADEPDEYTRFRPQDQVKVMNILPTMFYWQVLDPFNEEIKLLPFRGIIQKRTIRKSPDMWSIAPGEVKIIPGWAATPMIENMYKEYIIKETDNKPRPAETKNRPITYNFNNPTKQEEIINKIFLGIETPSRGNLNYLSTSNISTEPTSTGTTEITPLENQEPTLSVEDLAKELGVSVEPNI